MKHDPWLQFRCGSCGWTTPGTYNFRNDPNLQFAMPDSDCPKCGTHDGVVDTGVEVPAPADLVAVLTDINHGPHTRSGPAAYLSEDEADQKLAL